MGDRVLLRNFAKGGTGKLRSYWQDEIYLVKEKHPELPIFTIHPVNNKRKLKKVHRNIIMRCNDLPYMKNERKKVSGKKVQEKSKQRLLSTEVVTETESSEDDVVLRICEVPLSEGEEVRQELESSESDETFHGFASDEVDTSSEQSDGSTTIRKSNRTRRPKKLFTYTTLGEPTEDYPSNK